MSPALRVLFVLACAATMSTAHAQALPRTFDPFAQPAGTMRCRSILATEADSADMIFNFVDGDAMPLRETTVAFDSLGTPLYMALFSPETTPVGKRIVHAFAVRFGKLSKGSHIILPGGAGGSVTQSDTASANILASPSEEAFTEADTSRALVLAVWFWEHRCHSSRERGG